VAPGALVTLLGPSGCGKTTLLRLIAGPGDAPTRARCRSRGVDVTRTPPHKRNVGVVFQNYALFPASCRSRATSASGLKGRGLPKGRDLPRRVARALDLVQMGPFRDRPVTALFGRPAASAFALARAPGGRARKFSCSTRRSVRSTGTCARRCRSKLRRLLKNLGVTAVFVTHDQDEALTMSDRIRGDERRSHRTVC